MVARRFGDKEGIMICETCGRLMVMTETWNPENCCGRAVELVTVCLTCLGCLPERPQLTQDARMSRNPSLARAMAITSVKERDHEHRFLTLRTTDTIDARILGIAKEAIVKIRSTRTVSIVLNSKRIVLKPHQRLNVGNELAAKLMEQAPDRIKKVK